MNTTGPTIPVKKSDGTIQYMTIPEFKEYQAKILVSPTLDTTPSNPIPVAPLVSVPVTENHLATSTPVKDFFVDKAMAAVPNTWSKEDHASPLEEFPPVQNTSSDLISPWEQEAEKVVQKLADHVPDSLHARLHSLVMSYQKGVRTKEQVVEYLERPLTEGGLELDEDTISTVFDIVESHVPKKTPPKPASSLPLPQKPSTKPQNSPFLFSPDGQMVATRPSVSKPVLHDVVMGPTTGRQVVGPAEEMQFFTLVEWRRIPGSVSDRVARIQEKFETLKKDSFLLFLEARTSWYQSPLYREYQQLFLTALQSGASVESCLRGLNNDQTFTLEELNGIIEINRYLAF